MMLTQHSARLIIATLALSAGTASQAQQTAAGRLAPAASRIDPTVVDQIIMRWTERPRLGAREMIAKYGTPQEATAEQLMWRNVGPFKRITVFNLETPHDFPMPHVDYLEHTIQYAVPQDKVADLIAFDASSTINRTTGELSARCDLEGHNILTLNLDRDIIMGTKSVEQARKAFGDNVRDDVLGKHPPYVEGLQFQPATVAASAFSDRPVIPGSPVRPGEPEATMIKAGDSEVLAAIIAVDLNEVLAAGQAETKKISQPVLAFAKLMHEDHGMNMDQTMKLSQSIGTQPLLTPDVEKELKQGAGELAVLVPLDDVRFERAYIDAMVQGHTAVLEMIDSKLLTMASSDAVKKQLTETRAKVADHLAKAKALQK